jgi:hypothetical protein
VSVLRKRLLEAVAPINTEVRADSLDVGALLRMSLQIPAGHVSRAWKQRIDAGLHFRRIEDELGLATLLLHRVVARDRDLSEGLAIRGDPIAEHCIVHRVCQRRQAQGGGESNYDQSLQPMSNPGAQGCGHGVQLYPQPGDIRPPPATPFHITTGFLTPPAAR